jgi:hypothetical protein
MPEVANQIESNKQTALRYIHEGIGEQDAATSALFTVHHGGETLEVLHFPVLLHRYH